ncbi:hypothetical protein D3C73_1339100 [compost metagenome]
MSGLRAIPKDQSVVSESPLDGVHSSCDPRMPVRQEADARNQEEARVQFRAAVGLDEGVEFLVEALGHDVGMDLAAEGGPPIGRAGQA